MSTHTQLAITQGKSEGRSQERQRILDVMQKQHDEELRRAEGIQKNLAAGMYAKPNGVKDAEKRMDNHIYACQIIRMMMENVRNG